MSCPSADTSIPGNIKQLEMYSFPLRTYFLVLFFSLPLSLSVIMLSELAKWLVFLHGNIMIVGGHEFYIDLTTISRVFVISTGLYRRSWPEFVPWEWCDTREDGFSDSASEH